MKKPLADKRGKKKDEKQDTLIRTVSQQITAPMGYRLIAGFRLLRNRG